MILSIDKDKSQELFSKRSFHYGNKMLEYCLIRSRRRKTSEIIVQKDVITVRVPYDKTLTEIENILHEKINWIATKQKEFQQEENEIIKPDYKDGSTLPYLGYNYRLRVIIESNNKIDKLEFMYNQFIACLSNSTTNQKEAIKKLYSEWLSTEASRIFKEKVSKHSDIIGFNPTSIKIKDLKNRWGSLTKKGSINLNVNLVKTPEDIIDYIIIHELCHSKIQGHAYQFWNYLKQFEPDYERKIKWLERNTAYIL